MINIDKSKLVKTNFFEKANKEISELEMARALETRNINSFKTIQTLKTFKNKTVQIKNPGNIIRTLARLGYVSGSKVGIITNLIEVSMALMDMDYNKQFLIAGTNNIDMFKLGKVFTCVDSIEATEEGYAEIFTIGNNKIFEVTNTQDRQLTIVKATKADILMFIERLENMASGTQEDLVRIGRDLEKIGRLMQELEIDSAKDITKKDGMKEITEFMSSYTCKMANKNMVITNNFEEFKNNKKAKKGSKKNVQFVYGIEDYLPLSKMDEVFAQAVEKYDNDPMNNDKSSEDRRKELLIIKRDIRNEAVIECPLSELKKYMVSQQSVFFDQLAVQYENSNMDIFNPLQSLDIDAPLEAIEAVREMAIRCFRMITNNLSYSKNLAMTKLDEMAPILRNAFYTFAETKGIEAKDAFSIAGNAAWITKTMYNGRLVNNIGDFKFFAMSVMFATELKWFLNSDAMETIVEVELPEGLAIAPNTAFEFEDGMAEVEVNGELEYIVCTEEADYNGCLIAKIVNDEPAFVKYSNEFDFDYVEFMMFDSICDTNLESNKFIAKQSSPEAQAVATKAIEEQKTLGLNKGMANLAAQINAEKNGPVFENFANYIEISAMHDNFNLFSDVIGDRMYISIRNMETKASRMLGRLFGTYKTKVLSEYTDIQTIVNGAGAITILK